MFDWGAYRGDRAIEFADRYGFKETAERAIEIGFNNLFLPSISTISVDELEALSIVLQYREEFKGRFPLPFPQNGTYPWEIEHWPENRSSGKTEADYWCDYLQILSHHSERLIAEFEDSPTRERFLELYEFSRYINSQREKIGFYANHYELSDEVREKLRSIEEVCSPSDRFSFENLKKGILQHLQDSPIWGTIVDCLPVSERYHSEDFGSTIGEWLVGHFSRVDSYDLPEGESENLRKIVRYLLKLNEFSELRDTLTDKSTFFDGEGQSYRAIWDLVITSDRWVLFHPELREELEPLFDRAFKRAQEDLEGNFDFLLKNNRALSLRTELLLMASPERAKEIWATCYPPAEAVLGDLAQYKKSPVFCRDNHVALLSRYIGVSNIPGSYELVRDTLVDLDEEQLNLLMEVRILRHYHISPLWKVMELPIPLEDRQKFLRDAPDDLLRFDLDNLRGKFSGEEISHLLKIGADDITSLDLFCRFFRSADGWQDGNLDRKDILGADDIGELIDLVEEDLNRRIPMRIPGGGKIELSPALRNSLSVDELYQIISSERLQYVLDGTVDKEAQLSPFGPTEFIFDRKDVNPSVILEPIKVKMEVIPKSDPRTWLKPYRSVELFRTDTMQFSIRTDLGDGFQTSLWLGEDQETLIVSFLSEVSESDHLYGEVEIDYWERAVEFFGDYAKAQICQINRVVIGPYFPYEILLKRYPEVSGYKPLPPEREVRGDWSRMWEGDHKQALIWERN